MKILIADDDPGIIDSLTLVLAEQGHLIDTVSNGKVLTKVEKNKPDIILLDILMSGENGRDICKLIKSNDSTKNIPVIIISANRYGEKVAQEAGAEDFLAKPFEITDLMERINKYS